MEREATSGFQKSQWSCMYCGDKFDKAHAASCVKRQSAQVNAIVVNDLDHHLTDAVLQQLEVEDNITEESLSMLFQAHLMEMSSKFRA